MKKLNALLLASLILLSTFAVLPMVLAIDEPIKESIVIVYAIPPTDDSMTNPDYALLKFHWFSTINYYINPTNTYGFSTTAVVNTVTTSANTWDTETSYQVFSYKGTTTLTSGTYDGNNVVSWGSYQAGAIAVTYIWAKGKKILETDCRMNTYYGWSITGEGNKMDVQNIMTHEFGHWCGLKDLYNDRDYWLTMYGYSNYGLTYARTLGLGDINGLRKVYGP